VAGVYVFNQPRVLDPKLQSQFDQGKYADTVPAMEKWVAENPNDVKGMEVLAAFYIQKASNEQQVASENLKKAMKLLGTIIKLDPQRSESFRLLAITYLMKENAKLATENFLRAVRVSKGTNLDASAGLSMVHEFNKDWDKASVGYKNVLRKDPKNEMANLGVARYYISLGNANDAMDYAWKVANSSSNNASLGEAYAVLGSGMKILKQPEISKTYFEKSISFRPNNVHTCATWRITHRNISIG
jgi:Tfp pilus assembly protein PilF